MSETTVFQSGNSQAVRLPKEFRFKSKTVEIFRRGNEVVLREKPRTMADVLDSLPPVTPEMDKELELLFSIAREPLPERERDWAHLWGEQNQPAASSVTPTSTNSSRKPKRKPNTVAKTSKLASK